MKIKGTSLSLFHIQLSFGALSLPFFKLTHSFFAVKIIHDCRDKRPRKRVNLVLRDPRVVLSSRHSPLLCSSLDSLPPFKRLFSCYLPPRSRPLDLNGDAHFAALRSLTVSIASSSFSGACSLISLRRSALLCNSAFFRSACCNSRKSPL